MTAIEKLANLVTFDPDCKYELYDDTINSKDSDYHPGIDLYAAEAFSCSNGVVIATGTDGVTYSVTVQQDANTIFRYCNLSILYISAGAEVQTGFRIGSAQKYIHFEYCTREQAESKWCVRIGTEQYYKHDPLILFGDDNDG